MGTSSLSNRYLIPQIQEDLEHKMVFVAGPRQVGKTTMALALPGAREGYLNWDIAEHRERILRRELPSTVWERLTLGGYVDLTVDVSPAMPNRALQLTANPLRGSLSNELGR